MVFPRASLPFQAIRLSCFLLLCGCNSPGSQNNSNTPPHTITDGAIKTRLFCSTCHAYPEPSLLDKKTWKDQVLPRMGYFLGIFPDSAARSLVTEAGYAGRILGEKKIFPEQPLLPDSTWQQIVDYYLHEAPEQLTPAKGRSKLKPLERFKVRIPEFKLIPPSTTLARINNDGTLFIGDAHSQGLYQFDQALNLDGMAKAKEGPVWLNEADDAYLVTVMGSFSPTDIPSGFLMALPKNKKSAPRVLIDSLQRPVHSAMGDLDDDGLVDLVICEYSKWTGSFGWWKNNGRNQFTKHILRDKPGAIRAYLYDFDGNGLLDIIALFAQGDEGIYIYYNQGEGNFIEKKVLEFSPSHGSTSFQLHDFNQDSLPDIVYTAGDNADFPPVLKPYHGIYLFTNQGGGKFEETLFYPLNGAYGASLADFDLDGDLDIAAVSFFPDFEQHREEGFLYLENQGGFSFIASALADPDLGRWIVINSGDLDHDGDQDLVLGSLAFEVIGKQDLVDQWVEGGIPFVVLENQTK